MFSEFDVAKPLWTTQDSIKALRQVYFLLLCSKFYNKIQYMLCSVKHAHVGCLYVYLFFLHPCPFPVTQMNY